MLTIDELLNKIESHGIDQLSSSVPIKDRRILKNLAKMIKMPMFITESQGRLLIKILQENLESLHFIGPNLIPSLRSPTWTLEFRSVDLSRKISIVKDTNGNSVINIECSFNKDIKRILQTISKTMDGEIFKVGSKYCQFLLSEKNLLSIITQLKKYNFEYTQPVELLYNNITAINRQEIIDSFEVNNANNTKIQMVLRNEIDKDNILLVSDRRIKYQYIVKNLKTNTPSLAEYLAQRTQPKVFINSELYSAIDLILSLRELNRSKVLGIFDEYDVKSCIQNLQMIHSAFEYLGNKPNIGVYLRFPNEGEGKKFNQLVAEYGYNKQLDNNCRIAVIANGKLPKFFLKSSWYPDTTISFSHQFRNNKTSVYCNSCDMIVYYSTQAPLIGVVDAIM